MENMGDVTNVESRSFSSKKYFLIIAVVFILGGLYYLFFHLKNPNIPLQVITSEVLPQGAEVALYESAPPNFPRSVILENEPLNYSGVLRSPEGKEQYSVSYFSSMTKAKTASLYREELPKRGWEVVPQFASPESTVMSASKAQQTVLISISTLGNSRVLVTFQYEK